MSANAYADYVQSLPLLVYYKCDETSGTVITDYGPHGLDATLSGTLGNVTTGIGQFASILDFDGSTNVVTLPTDLNSLFEVLFAQLNYAGVFTINFWAAWDGYESDSRDGVIGNLWDANDGDGFGVFFDDRSSQSLTNALAWRVSGNSSSTGLTFNPSVVPDTSFYMHTLVGDGTNLTIYRNASSGGSGAIPTRQGFIGDSLTFGAIESNGSTDWFDGRLGQISIHPVALTQAQITALYNLGTNARTVAGNTTLNGSAVQHNIAVLDPTDGRIAGSAVADGSGDYSIDAATENAVFVIDFDDYGTEWQASTAYVLNDRVHPSTANGYYYECTTAGTSGGTEPTWPTSGTVNDNTAVWTAVEYPRPRIHGPIEVV